MRIHILALTAIVTPDADLAFGQIAVDCVAIFDSNAERIARIIDNNTDRDKGHGVYFDHQGTVVPVGLLGSVYVEAAEGSPVYFLSPDCSTTPLQRDADDEFLGSSPVGNVIYYPDRTQPLASATVQSQFNSLGMCVAASGQFPVRPAVQFTLSFVPPFHVEAEECVQPASVASFTPLPLLAMCLLTFGVLVFRKRTG